MRVLVTGAAGAVGTYVPEVFPDAELVLTDVHGDLRILDIADPDAVRRTFRDVRPDLVLHLAAATDVDRCQLDPELAYRSNAIGTENIARACEETDAELVYVSTAAVFSGEKETAYTEYDEPGPANVYGHSKLAGERAAAALAQHYIVRAGWMVGGAKLDHKFVGKLSELIRSGQTTLRAVDDKWGSPVFARDLVLGIRELVASGDHGLYHLVNAGEPVTRYEIALELRAILARDDVVIEPVSSDAFPLPAPRGRSEGMRNYKLQLLGRDPMRPWQDALRAYVVDELVPELELRNSAA